MKIDEIGTNIKNFRKASHLTQKEVAARLFMEERNYAKIERGEKKTLCITTLLSISEVLNVDLMDLLATAEPPKEKHQKEQTDTEISLSPKELFSKITLLQKELTAIKTGQQLLENKLEELI